MDGNRYVDSNNNKSHNKALPVATIAPNYIFGLTVTSIRLYDSLHPSLKFTLHLTSGDDGYPNPLRPPQRHFLYLTREQEYG